MARIERTKNASRNIFFGFLLQIYRIVVPFVIRTAVIHFLGIQYLGLNSLFSSVLQVLNLAELGAGSAMVFSMYKPIAEDDDAKICALVKLYRKYYTIIGLTILVAGLLLLPFIPKLIIGDIPNHVNIYVLYLISLSTTVLSYLLFAYNNSILAAYQRNDVISKISIVSDTIQYAVQLAVLWILKNYYVFVSVTLVAQVLNNLLTLTNARKMYPSLKPSGALSKEEVKGINQRIKDLFSAKLGTVLGTSVDTLVISSFLGLTSLAVYQNYYFIMNAVVIMIQIIFNSVRAGIGNSLVLDNTEKNYKDFESLSFAILWICIVCVTCFINVFQPFMIIWVGDEYLLPFHMVLFFSMYFFLVVIQNLSCTYKDASGIWHEDRWRPLIAGIFNLILNILLVKRWGLSGVLLSTIISHLLIAMPWVIHNLFKLVFKRDVKAFCFKILSGFCLAIVTSVVVYAICSNVRCEGVVKVVVNLFLSLVVSNLFLFIIYHKSQQFAFMVSFLRNMRKR